MLCVIEKLPIIPKSIFIIANVKLCRTDGQLRFYSRVREENPCGEIPSVRLINLNTPPFLAIFNKPANQTLELTYPLLWQLEEANLYRVLTVRYLQKIHPQTNVTTIQSFLESNAVFKFSDRYLLQLNDTLISILGSIDGNDFYHLIEPNTFASEFITVDKTNANSTI